MSRVPGVIVRKAFRARGKIRRDFAYDEHKKSWKGPVERRDPKHYQQRSVVGVKRCASPVCRHWIASDAGRCTICHERQ
jgi:hypothetical protein